MIGRVGGQSVVYVIMEKFFYKVVIVFEIQIFIKLTRVFALKLCIKRKMFFLKYSLCEIAIVMRRVF